MILCSSCGAQQPDGHTCLDDFHMMGFWELDHQLYDVHHLMVLSYYLQHPNTLSQEWLAGAKRQLVDYIEHDVTPQMMRQQIASTVDSGTRDYTIRATSESTASYDFPIEWTMTAQDVVAGGIDNYYANVQKWAVSILAALRTSNNF